MVLGFYPHSPKFHSQTLMESENNRYQASGLHHWMKLGFSWILEIRERERRREWKEEEEEISGSWMFSQCRVSGNLLDLHASKAISDGGVLLHLGLLRPERVARQRVHIHHRWRYHLFPLLSSLARSAAKEQEEKEAELFSLRSVAGRKISRNSSTRTVEPYCHRTKGVTGFRFRPGF